MTLAFSSKHPFVPNPSQNPQASRWIASLSDGTTVFEDITPGERSAWLRLRDYVAQRGLQLTNLRLEAYGHRIVLIPYRDSDGNPQVNGYWHSKSMTAILHQNGVLEMSECGIGILKGREILITWVTPDGTVKYESRPYKPNDKAVIINDAP